MSNGYPQTHQQTSVVRVIANCKNPNKLCKHLRRYTWVFILYLAYVIGCITAIFMPIALQFSKNNKYKKNFTLAADRMCAAMLSTKFGCPEFSGRVTLSTECTHALRWLHDVLNDIDDYHCEEAAITENAYCKLSDHTMGYK